MHSTHSARPAHHIYPDTNLAPALHLEEIKRMLLFIEQTHPQDIRHPDQLVQLGPYSFAQLRLAIAMQTLSCVNPPEPWFRLTRQRKATKPLNEEQTACLSAHFSALHESVLPQTVRMQIVKEGDLHPIVVRFEFPIFDPTPIAPFIRFNDYRHQRHTSLYEMQQGATQQQIRHMWLGLQFLCNNLRRWNSQPGITWPEEIAH